MANPLAYKTFGHPDPADLDEDQIWEELGVDAPDGLPEVHDSGFWREYRSLILPEFDDE